MSNSFSTLEIGGKSFKYADIATYPNIQKLPFSYRVLLENLVRQKIGNLNPSAEEQISNILNFRIGSPINFMPNRILSHDILGKVMLVDFLAYREALQKKGIDPNNIQPKIPIDVVIDHSLQVDFFGSETSRIENLKKEYDRNSERFSFLRWCSKNLKNVRVIPPGVGICHQVNIEYLSKVVWTEEVNSDLVLHPDTCIGTDSHTPMMNAIGVLGWGVGGVEAEISMIGKLLPITLPEVVGVHLTNKLQEGITSTDLVLTITELLRKSKVVGCFIEFFGEGVETLSVGDRATISNMAPEYGATAVLFPVDNSTLDYLKMTGRIPEQIQIIKEYSMKQCLWRNPSDLPDYSRSLDLDLSSIVPCVSGPKNPEDKIKLDEFSSSINSHSQMLYKKDLRKDQFPVPNLNFSIQDGDILIAAITSCTNTANPRNVIAAGMVAKKLVEFGFKRNPKVKTSFAPGSKVTAEILKQSGLQKYLDELGFNVVGFGCTTCNGSSGPLHKDIADTIENNKIFSTAVLSGNRNFQGRIHPNIRASYLASPALIVLFSLIGSATKNLTKDSLGTDKDGKLVYLKDVWPENHEINTIVDSFYKPETFVAKYKEVNDGGELWENLAVSESDNYEWSDKSTYIKKPPYLENISQHTEAIEDIHLARPLVLLGDSVTTDHISPSSDITKTTAAWDYLLSQNIKPEDFNNFLTRRANHEIVKRSAFASLRLRNLMTPELEGSFTIKYPENKVMRIFEAATEYQKTKTELVVIAGENYGCGSSRDVAAKGPLLLGIRAIIAKGFERIHRSNLVGMGLLPLEFLPGNGIDELGIVATDLFTIKGLDKITIDHKEVDLLIQKESGDVVKVKLKARLDNPDEVIFWKNGGILQTAWKEA